MNKKIKAFLTGCNGQDGSYLAELLLEKGYEVYGMVRRSSSDGHLSKLENVIDNKNFHLISGDLQDEYSLIKLMDEIKPDEVYNLAAQSHVRVSFDQPQLTRDINFFGLLRLSKALYDANPNAKLYQASTSELFGEVLETPQNEDTPFNPVSPYAKAKFESHKHIKDLRKQGKFACSGVLFNHETISSFMPLFCRKNEKDLIDIKPISEIVKFDQNKNKYQEKQVTNIQVWDKGGWTNVKFASAYPHDINNDNKKPRFINSRSGAVMATSNHKFFMDDASEVEAKNIFIGNKLEIIDLPLKKNKSNKITLEEAELIGLMVGDGSISYAKKGIGVSDKFTNSSKDIRNRFNYLWKKITNGSTVYYPSKSGFNPNKIVGQLRLVAGNNWLRSLDLYNEDKTKRVPKKILNSNKNIMEAFLHGYNLADGLKQNKCIYEFRNFKTNSATLAMGLWYLIENTTKQKINLTIEQKKDGRLFYSMNLLSPTDNNKKKQITQDLLNKNISIRKIHRLTKISRKFIQKINRGIECAKIHHLRKDSKEVKKIIELPKFNGWFYDLETESGTFHCGIGKCHVHNSPRRGINFVTRKITKAIANINAGLQDKLELGNVYAKRDWGHSKDYVEAMWKMLQLPEPQDFVIGTGETHTIKEFITYAFNHINMKLTWKGEGIDEKAYDQNGIERISINPKYFRPNEVALLLADPTKANTILGWKPKINLEELVKQMLESDIKNL